MKESVVSLPHRRDVLGIKSIEKFTQLFKWQDPDVIEKRNKEIGNYQAISICLTTLFLWYFILKHIFL